MDIVGPDNLLNCSLVAITGVLSDRNVNYSKICKKHSYNTSGSRNPNYKGGNHNKCRVCNKSISSYSKHCFKHRDISGSNNGFYGKQHSDITKAKIRKTRLKYPQKLPSNTLSVNVNGVIHKSASKAALDIGCTTATILNRCNNPKFTQYKFIE